MITCKLFGQINLNDLSIQCPREDRAECWIGRKCWLKADRLAIAPQREAACQACENIVKPKEMKVNPNQCPNCGYTACCGDVMGATCPKCGMEIVSGQTS